MQRLVAFLLFFISAPIYADQVICQGHLRNKTIDADLLITQKCILDNAKILGNIELQDHASLILKRSQVNGNIQTNAYFSGLHIEETAIDGNIHIRSGRELKLIKNQVTGTINIQNNIGNILLKNNHSQILNCVHNRILPQGMQNQANQKLEQCRDL